jgi:hypothetical protein
MVRIEAFRIDHRIGCVTAGGVEARGNDAGMQEAVLLRQLVVEGQLDLHRAMLDAGELGADQPHRRLPVEASGDAAGKIGGRKIGHGAHMSAGAPAWNGDGRGLHGPCCTASIFQFNPRIAALRAVAKSTQAR